MLTVNEQTSAILSLSFTNEYGRAVTPESGRYRIDDVETDTNITPWTFFTPTSSTHDIYISNLENRILDETHPSEGRRATVIVYYSAGKQSTTEYLYEVVNLEEVPPSLYVVGSGGAVAGGST